MPIITNAADAANPYGPYRAERIGVEALAQVVQNFIITTILVIERSLVRQPAFYAVHRLDLIIDNSIRRCDNNIRVFTLYLLHCTPP